MSVLSSMSELFLMAVIGRMATLSPFRMTWRIFHFFRALSSLFPLRALKMQQNLSVYAGLHGLMQRKISLTGHSMGGTGTYQLQVRLPNTFSCIAPMSGSIQNNEANLTALSKTKIWAFVGTDDTIVSPDSSKTIINELNEKGATAKITELDGATHFDVPSLAYKNDDLIKWLVNCGE